MFFRSLQWRLVVIIISITISLMIVVGVFLNMKMESSYYDMFKKSIESGFNNWDLKGKPDPSFNEIYGDLKDKRDAVYFFGMITEYKSYTIINKKTGKIEYSSDKKYNENGEKFLNAILKSDNLLSVMANPEKKGDRNKLTHSDDSVFFDYARSVGDYILYFRYDREEWLDTIRSFNKIILSSLLIAIVISLGIGYILSNTITVPIVNIMHKAQEIASGDFDQVLEVKSEDEIGKLTGTFNYMAQELKNTLIEISSEKNKIETILNYMTDGVIAFNLKGEVIHINPASKKMLGVNDINQDFNSFSSKYNLGLSLEDILYLDTAGSNEKEAKDINVNDKFIRVYFALFTDEAKKAEGIIAVLQDITEQQKLDMMRKEFVANVSHELRTPLTSIKSYAETLLDGVLEDRETSERFLGVINSEADRMTRLVKDLLQLSRLDNQQMQWNMKDISFVNLVKSCVEKMQIEAGNKNQTLESYVIGDIPEIKADRDRIEQVVINLLSNAIKYTPSGGKITVYIGKMYSEVYAKVVDTGIGIPKDDISRVFERFYRVDKARSREMGGTGLGLAIAKEIVDVHGGNISINSEFGKGTEVTVKLPICN